MTVYVVTDSTSCLPPALAAEYGITVLDIHTSGQIPGGSEDAAGPGETVSNVTAAMDSAQSEIEGDPERAVQEGDLAEGSESLGSDAGRGAVPDIAPGDEPNTGDDTDGDGGKDLPAPEPEEPTTSGLGPLELTATYARLLERGGDDGVVALHLSRELSSTWSSANQAAAVFDGLVEVVDTRTAGMALGQAAIAAARCAAAGGTLAECTDAATRVLMDADVWLYVHRLDALARGGRLSTAQRLLSTALAIKPILHLNEGKIELAAKTRTQSKAMNRLISLIEEAYRQAATPIPAEAAEPDAEHEVGTEAGVDEDSNALWNATNHAPGEPSGEQLADDTVVPLAADADDDIRPMQSTADGRSETTLDAAAPGATDTSKVEAERPRVFTFSGEHDFWLRKKREQPSTLAELPPTVMHLDIHQVGCAEMAEELRNSLRDALPQCVAISVVDLSPALLVHTGPQALGVSFVKG